MKRIIYFLICCLTCCLGIWSCIDEIALNVDTEQRTLIVDGFVTDSLGDFQVKLSESSVIGIGNDNILDPVPGATVQLLDDGGQSYPYMESEETSGVYELTNFKAERGKAYFIDVVLPNGKHYQSIPASLRSSSKIDNISYEVMEETIRNNVGDLVTNNQIQTKIASDFSNAEEPPFLRWRVSGEYQLQEQYRGALNPRRCYVKVNLDINDIKIFDAAQVNGAVLLEQVIAQTEYDFRFGDQFCFHISQFSISEDEFNYWSNIKEVIDIDGSLFDPPPGTVIGNIRNVEDANDVAVGYFSVASVSFVRNFINSDELDFFVRPKCAGFFFTPPFGCMDCEAVNNSTLEKPAYWEF